MDLVGQNKAEQDVLVEKWDKKGFKLSEISNEDTQRMTAVLLENQYNQLMNEDAANTVTGDIATYRKIVMPLVRRIFPTLIANDLVAVQPMAGPVGLAYALRFKYKTTTTGGATSGDEMGYNTVHQGYSGDADALPASGAGGMATADGEVLGTTGNDDMVDAGLAIEQTTVTAKTRKMKTQWSLESAQDLKAMHGVDIERELISMLQYEISAETDREIINNMHALCTAGNNNLRSIVVDNLDGQWEAEKFRNLYTRIVQDANSIATATRRGPGNFIIASPNVVTALDSVGNFLISPINASAMDLGPGLAKVGSIEGRFDVYRDTFAVNDYAITGYKGPSVADAGIIYSPYVPIMLTKAVQPNSFHPVLGVLTRYALTNNLFGAENYYRKLNVDFTGIF